MAPRERNELMALTKRLVVERGMACCSPSTAWTCVRAYADRMIVLARGRLIAEGTPAEIRGPPGAGGLLRQRQDLRGEARWPATMTTAPALPAPDPRCRVAWHLAAWYGAAQILFDVDLEVGRGEVVALMGRNGAGKSTTLPAVMGMVDRRRGSIRFMGGDIASHPPIEVAARRAWASCPKTGASSPTSRCWRTSRSAASPAPLADMQRRAGVTPERLFNVPQPGRMPHRPGGRMSGGEQQMLTVARTLMGNPFWCCWTSPARAWRR